MLCRGSRSRDGDGLGLSAPVTLTWTLRQGPKPRSHSQGPKIALAVLHLELNKTQILVLSLNRTCPQLDLMNGSNQNDTYMYSKMIEQSKTGTSESSGPSLKQTKRPLAGCVHWQCLWDPGRKQRIWILLLC